MLGNLKERQTMSETIEVQQYREEAFRVFEGEPTYVDGYLPSSFDSQHSSLQRSSTWCGMGLVLTALAGLGTLIFGFATLDSGTQEHATTFIWIGAVLTLVCVVGGFGLIHYGRRYYRAYVAATGRK